MRLTNAVLAALLCLAIAPACAQETDDAQAATEAAAPAAAPAEIATPAPAGADLAATASPDAATLGEASAPVTIIEYASTTCPHCANFHATLFPHIKESWIDTGRAKLVMRPLPTAPAQLAVAGFLVARCAGDDYFAVLDDLFTTQPQLFEAANTGELQAYYEGIGEQNGLSADQIETCFADESGLAQITASVEAANADMVSGTPSFVIDGTLYSAAELPDEASWDAALQAAFDAH